MDYMARALQLAARALGTSSPNPAVGAVLAKDGRVVGEGSTQPPGQAHAEIMALRQAGQAARGATMYVTLEPCAHYGRTPPCVDAIIAAGVAEVQMATIDPSPWVNGKGRAALEAAGIRTTVGTLEREVRCLNEGYLTWVATGRPLVTAVYAMTLDGAIAEDGPAGPTDDTVRAELERLRSRSDRWRAGLGSLLDDDPRLQELGQAGVTTLLIECGRADLHQLLAGGLPDKIVALIVPTLIGPESDEGAAPAGTPQPIRASQLGHLHELSYERLGDTLMVVGYTRPCSQES
jgi:diaminohydroxyphosphoribosylaminopyrimidine deaminase/5-amino-6-(5-phosphoribosylamino)uracil reductase